MTFEKENQGDVRMATYPVTDVTISPDLANARRHTPRNVDQIERSITTNGFGRAILLASDGTIIAGNATFDAATAAGLDTVEIVESDGTKVIAIRRTDVDSGTRRFAELSLADNRAAQLAEWDAATILALTERELIDPNDFFFENELDELLADLTSVSPPDEFASYDENLATDFTCPKCGYEWSGAKT